MTYRLRGALRVTAFLAALALVGLWGVFLRAAFATALGGVPAPGAFMVTLIFGGIAVAGGVAALRDAPVAVTLSGLISLLPVGLYLALFPGVTRWIGMLDGMLLGLGLALMRAEVPSSRPCASNGSHGPPP